VAGRYEWRTGAKAKRCPGCFRRVPPEPPGHNKTCSGPPVT